MYLVSCDLSWPSVHFFMESQQQWCLRTYNGEDRERWEKDISCRIQTNVFLIMWRVLCHCATTKATNIWKLFYSANPWMWGKIFILRQQFSFFSPKFCSSSIFYLTFQTHKTPLKYFPKVFLLPFPVPNFFRVFSYRKTLQFALTATATTTATVTTTTMTTTTTGSEMSITTCLKHYPQGFERWRKICFLSDISVFANLYEF